jgi:hypothetical protein
MTDIQVYNLFAGLTVVIVLFGGLGLYALRSQPADAESRRVREIRENLRAAKRSFRRVQ